MQDPNDRFLVAVVVVVGLSLFLYFSVGGFIFTHPLETIRQPKRWANNNKLNLTDNGVDVRQARTMAKVNVQSIGVDGGGAVAAVAAVTTNVFNKILLTSWTNSNKKSTTPEWQPLLWHALCYQRTYKHKFSMVLLPAVVTTHNNKVDV